MQSQILSARLVCIMPAHHPLPACTEVTPAQLLDQRIILVDPATAPGLLREMLDGLGIRFDDVLETNLSYTAVNLVRHNAGIFVSDPVILLSGLADGLAIRSLSPSPEITLTVVDDASQVGPLLDQVMDPDASPTADGAYDRQGVQDDVTTRHPDAAMVMPPAMHFVHFRPRRHLMAASRYRAARATAFKTWTQETCAQSVG